MKKAMILLLVLIGSLCLNACGHEHVYSAATCEKPAQCSCGETSGEALGHDYDGATCVTPQTCCVCGDVQGEALGHDYLDATCVAPKTCRLCNDKIGEALEHDFTEATYESPKVCKSCGITDGAPLEGLSSFCDLLLSTGEYNGDTYELVANQIDGYPDSTFEFGVIKNNEWIVPMGSACPFIDDKGWWKGAEYSNTPGEFRYLSNGCFYYEKKEGISSFEVIYKPATGISFDIVNFVAGAPIVNENGEVLTGLRIVGHSYKLYAFSYLNMNSGATKEIPLELHVNNNQEIGVLSDGVFYAYGGSNFTGTDYWGFFNVEGEQIIDLLEYSDVELHGYVFKDGKYMITCTNNSGVKYNITFDTSGEIISTEKA